MVPGYKLFERVLGIMNLPLGVDMIRGTVHLSLKKAVETGHRQ